MMNVVGTLIHVPMQVGDRYLWTLPMFHANGWTFTWIVTAVGGTHVCSAGSTRPHLRTAGSGADRRPVRGATVLIGLANAPGDLRRDARETQGGDRRSTTSAGDDRIARIWPRLTIIHVYGLTETAPFITVCEPRPEHGALDLGAGRREGAPGVELITSAS